MSKRAEERAEAFQDTLDYQQSINMWLEDAFQKGYEQAEKDLGWRSAETEKPNPSEWVVVCVKDHGTPQCLDLATYNEELDRWFTDQFEDGVQEEYFPDYWLRIPDFIEKENHGTCDYSIYDGILGSGEFKHVLVRGQFVLKDRRIVPHVGKEIICGVK